MNSVVEEIKNRLDIKDIVEGYLKLEKTGTNYRATCPFHSEKTPSFFVSSPKQIFKCFGCGVSGDIFKFIMLIENIEFPEALKILAEKAGLELKKFNFKKDSDRQRILDINQSATKFFRKQLESQTGKKAKEYLLSRAITEKSIEDWEIGYSPNKWGTLKDFLNQKGVNDSEIEKSGLVIRGSKGFYDRFRGRIMFPIFDISSQVIAFGGRIFEKPAGEEEGSPRFVRLDSESKRTGEAGAKYLNIPNTEVYDKSSILYGIDRAKKEAKEKDYFVLVEGYTDAIMAHQAGCKNAVATCGTSLTDFHLRLLGRYSKNLRLCFDMDFAGESATKRGINLAINRGFDLKIIRLSHGKDPAELIKENKEEWEKSVNEAVSIMDFYFQIALEKFNKETMEGKKEIGKIILPVIKKIYNKIEQGFWIQKLSKELRLDEKYIFEELKKISAPIEAGKKETEFIKEKKNNQQILENELLKILINKPKLAEKISEDVLEKISSSTKEILKKIKANHLGKKDLSEIDNLTADFADEEIEKIKTLSLEFELEKQGYLGGRGIDNLEKEFDNILREIQVLFLRERLSGLLEEIKIAEEAGEKGRAENLLKDFNVLRSKIEELKFNPLNTASQ